MEGAPFFILSIISILLGVILFLNKRLSIISFFIFLVLLPSSNLFKPILSISGVMYYDFYFFILALHFFISTIVKKKINKSSIISIVSLCSFVSFYCLISLYKGVILDKYLFRDLRPFLTLIYGMLLLDFLTKNFLYLKHNLLGINDMLRILIIAFFSHILIFLFLLYFAPYVTTDIYYNQQVYRYIDAKSYIAALFIISALSFNMKMINAKRILVVSSLFLACIVLLISNSRTLLGIIVLLVLLVSNFKFYKKIIFTFLLGGCFFLYIRYFEISRIVSLELLSSFATRYGPAISKINEMSIFEVFFGYGFRTFFEIPWFGYRDLDPYLNSVDSLYLTFFVKYGIFSIVLISLFFRIITANIQNKRYRRLIILFFLLLFITYSTLYQNYSIIYIFYLIVFSLSTFNFKINIDNKNGIGKILRS